MAPKSTKTSKITLDKFARTTQQEFLHLNKEIGDIRKNMATKEDQKLFATKKDLELFATKEDLKLFATKKDLELFATKEDLKLFATKEDLSDLRGELKDDIRKGTVDVLRAVDVIVTKFDKVEKDHAADKLLHDRHEKRLERVELKLGIKA